MSTFGMYFSTFVKHIKWKQNHLSFSTAGVLKRWEVLNVSSATAAIRKLISIRQRFHGEPKTPWPLKIETAINSCLTVPREQ